MSVRLYTQEEIVNHLENSSLSKYMYSFGKARRFRTIDKRGKSDMLYILPSTKMTRKAGIGYGRKYDFTKDNHRDTEFISLKRSYDPQNCPGYKYSFGLGRDKFKKQVVPGYRNIDMNIPGPAKYDILKSTGSELPKYSFRKLCGETFWVNRHMNNPSPAEYGYQPYINEKGRFINSKVCNIKGAAFSRDHSNRWTQYNRKI
jgi:hypothetical protein